MRLKIHFFNSHLGFFPENLGAMSENQGERFHRDIKEMERRYQGRWNVNMMGDYCWTLHREISETSHEIGATYAASSAREEDSTRPLNKI
jgi:hypothetical protein